jgi:hypothetical protein
MDGAVQHPSSERDAIEAAARDMGVVPGDPAYPFVRWMQGAVDTHAREHREHERRLAQLLDRSEKMAGGQLGKTAAAELPAAIDRLVLQRYRVLVVRAAAVIVAAFGLGMGVHWRFTPPAPKLTCEEQQGGRVCYVWTRPPTETAAEPQMSSAPVPAGKASITKGK